jgi:hypothetical protein
MRARSPFSLRLGPAVRLGSGAAAVALASVAALAPGIAGAASNPRSRPTVAGVRAAINSYDHAILADRAQAACAVLTPAARRRIARANHASSCIAVIHAAYELLKSDHRDAAELRSYGSKVKVTLHGHTATVPKLGAPGRTTLSYIHGLWYVS